MPEDSSPSTVSPSPRRECSPVSPSHLRPPPPAIRSAHSAFSLAPPLSSPLYLPTNSPRVPRQPQEPLQGIRPRPLNEQKAAVGLSRVQLETSASRSRENSRGRSAVKWRSVALGKRSVQFQCGEVSRYWDARDESSEGERGRAWIQKVTEELQRSQA